MYIAFYKKPHTLFERLISFFTKSKYVHCEIVSIKQNKMFYGYSSEPSKGVRAKWTSYNDNDWEFFTLPKCFNADTLKSFYDKTKGSKYDYLGVLGFVLNTKQNPKRYFCSEWCAEYLTFSNTHSITPGMLYDMTKDQK